MNKVDLIKAVARRSGLTQATVRQVLGAADVALADARAKGERLPSLVLTEPTLAPGSRFKSPPSATLNQATAHLVSDMHDPVTGRLDAKRVAAFYAISVKALSQAIARPYAAVAKTPNGAKLQAPLSAWERIAAPFQRFAEPAVALRMWLNAPHPDLGDEPPLSFMLEGHSEGIIDLVVSRMLGQPG